MSEYSEYQTSIIKKYFPAPAAAIIRKTTDVATTYTAATPGVNHQTDIGAVEITIAVPPTAGCTGVLVVFGAPDNATAKLWLDDATTDSDSLQVRFIPADSFRTFHFSPAVTVFDMKAIGAATPVYIEKAR